MELINEIDSNFSIYEFIFLSILLFFFLRLLIFLLPFVVKRKSSRKKIERYLPVIELIIWILFLSWSVRTLSERNRIFALGIFIIMLAAGLWLAWIVLKDYVAGVIFRLDKNHTKGQFIRFDNISGHIEHYGYRTLVIQTENNDMAEIPYSHLFNKSIFRSTENKKLESGRFVIKVRKSDPPEEISENIRISLLQLPWISSTKDPVVRIKTEEEKHYVFEILVYVIENKYIKRVNDYLTHKFQ